MGEAELYKKMYMLLFHGITDSLGQLEARNYGAAAERLREAQLQAEECYLDGDADA